MTKKLDLRRKRALLNIPSEQRSLRELKRKEELRRFVDEETRKQKILLEEGFEPLERRVKRHVEIAPLFDLYIDKLRVSENMPQITKMYEELEKFFLQGYLNSDQLKRYKDALNEKLDWLKDSKFKHKDKLESLVKAVNEILKSKVVDPFERVKIPDKVIVTPAPQKSLEDIERDWVLEGQELKKSMIDG